MKKILLLTISTLTLTSFSVMAQSKKQTKKSVPKKKSVEIITSKKNDENNTLVWTTDVMKADSISKKTNKPSANTNLYNIFCLTFSILHF
jgi:hypothetical protein